METGWRSLNRGDRQQRWNACTVVDAEFLHQRHPLLPDRLVENHRTVGIRHRPVKRAGWNTQDVAATVETHDVERLIPGQVDEVERSPTTGGQKIVFLVRMEIELPGPCLLYTSPSPRD